MNTIQENGWHRVSAPKKRTIKQYSKYPFACNNNNCINVTNQSEIELQNSFSILQDIDDEHSENQYSILYDNNRVKVNIAGYSINSMIDTGSSVSAINNDLYSKISKTTNMYIRNECRTCILADGSDIILDKIVTLPVKLNKLTFNADLYILPVKHIDMIMIC